MISNRLPLNITASSSRVSGRRPCAAPVTRRHKGAHTFAPRALLVLLLAAATAAHAVDTLYDQRFDRWTEQAQAGSAAAQYSLGNAYLRGNEVARNVKQALFWLRKSAAQGYAKAEFKLGYLYYSGKGEGQDDAEAFRLLSRSAQRGYSPAQYYLGRIYAEGKGTGQDYRKALHWYRRAAADDYPSARAAAAKLEAAIAQAAGRQAPRPTRAATPRERTTGPAQEAANTGRGLRNTKVRLVEGSWINAAGAPASRLPSTLNNCTAVAATVVCTTGRLQRSTPHAQISYLVESKFSRFTPQGEFKATYRTKVLFVLPEDPDNPEPTVAVLPSTGWTPETTWKCSFIDDKHVDCVNEHRRHERFSR